MTKYGWILLPLFCVQAKAQCLKEQNDQKQECTVDTITMQAPAAKKVRATGFRVQVYAGGNSRNAKSRAFQMEHRVHLLFPEYPVYTRFVSPKWICHVGDFRTREAAMELLTEMRSLGSFPEAIVVKCKVNLPPEEETDSLTQSSNLSITSLLL